LKPSFIVKIVFPRLLLFLSTVVFWFNWFSLVRLLYVFYDV